MEDNDVKSQLSDDDKPVMYVEVEVTTRIIVLRFSIIFAFFMLVVAALFTRLHFSSQSDNSIGQNLTNSSSDFSFSNLTLFSSFYVHMSESDVNRYLMGHGE